MQQTAGTEKQGVIVKGIGGFYYVYAQEGIYECRARGRFRYNDMTPLPGDRVRFAPGKDNKDGYLLAIDERKSQLKRPPVANVDQLVLVVSASRPRPDLILVDKLLVQAERQGIGALLALNKCDVAEADIAERVESNYRNLPLTFCRVSARQSDGIELLRRQLLDKLSCFAGQSAVGKSSLLNALSHSLALQTGGLSRKTGRGKHTTRAIELRPLDGASHSFVMDTPGFSMLNLDDLLPEELAGYYPEMQAYAGQCRFDNCLHVNEPRCAIKAAVEDGQISKGRYERYLLILKELQEAQSRRYR